jgi:glutaredoxin
MKRIVFGLLLTLLCSTVSHAEMYRWEDENGVVTFKDTPPPESKKRKAKVYINSDFAPDPPPPSQNSRQNKSQSKARQGAQPEERKPVIKEPIEMYVTDWCSVCKRAESYMKNRGYPFVAYDIDKDSAAKQRFKSLGGRGVPLIIFGGQKISGFSAAAIDQYMQGR